MIILVMGVSGAGKSTFAQALAARLGCSFLEGDELHPASNVAKMRAGHPLTDADRGPWLQAITQRAQALSQDGRPVVIACSALKAAYRRVLMPQAGGWLLIYLKARPDELGRRLGARQGHFMPPTLLESQLATLEEPSAAEHALVLDSETSGERNLALAEARVRAVKAGRGGGPADA